MLWHDAEEGEHVLWNGRLTPRPKRERPQDLPARDQWMTDIRRDPTAADVRRQVVGSLLDVGYVDRFPEMRCLPADPVAHRHFPDFTAVFRGKTLRSGKFQVCAVPAHPIMEVDLESDQR